MKTLAKMKKSKKSKDDLLKDLEFLRGYVAEMKLALLYLNFDVEACNREKATLQKEINKLRGEK